MELASSKTRSVLVEGGIIRSVGGEHPASPADANVVDGTGKTLLPGLIDAHTHTIGENALQQAPVFGVTTDLDMFTDPSTAARIKKEQEEGNCSIMSTSARPVISPPPRAATAPSTA